jgi:hypothetical protein
MLLFPRRIEYALDVPVDRSHDTYPREHRRPVTFCNQHQRCHCSLPFFGIVLCLRQFRDVERGIAEGDQSFAARQHNRIKELLIPRNKLTSLREQVRMKPKPHKEMNVGKAKSKSRTKGESKISETSNR